MKLRRIAKGVALGGLAALSVGTVVVVITSCSNSLSYTTTAAVSGPQDMHCILQDGGPSGSSYLFVQPTNAASCNYMPPIDAFGSPFVEAGAPDAPPEPPEFGATMYNSSGHDDDCKYYVQWKSTEADENNNVYFLATAMFNAVNPTVPLTGYVPNVANPNGAYPYIEAYIGNHTAPPTNQTFVEGPPGTYKVGPIQFDQTGMWTVRFHWNGNCLDYAPDSPHGHSAFFVNVGAK